MQKSAFSRQQRLVRRARQMHAIQDSKALVAQLQVQVSDLQQQNLALQRRLLHPCGDSTCTSLRVPSKIAARVQAVASSLEQHQCDCEAAQQNIHFARNSTDDKAALRLHKRANKGKHDKFFSHPWWTEGQPSKCDPWLQTVAASRSMCTDAAVTPQNKPSDTACDLWSAFHPTRSSSSEVHFLVGPVGTAQHPSGSGTGASSVQLCSGEPCTSDNQLKEPMTQDAGELAEKPVATDPSPDHVPSTPANSAGMEAADDLLRIHDVHSLLQFSAQEQVKFKERVDILAELERSCGSEHPRVKTCRIKLYHELRAHTERHHDLANELIALNYKIKNREKT